MKVEDIFRAIKKRQEGMEQGVFTKPPADWNEFLKMAYTWRGLSEALIIIEDARKKEKDDD